MHGPICILWANLTPFSHKCPATHTTCNTPQKCCPFGAVSNVSLLGERGATFRMWRGDYANPAKYIKSEYRHGVYVNGGSSHIRIEGLRIELTGARTKVVQGWPKLRGLAQHFDSLGL